MGSYIVLPAPKEHCQPGDGIAISDTKCALLNIHNSTKHVASFIIRLSVSASGLSRTDSSLKGE